MKRFYAEPRPLSALFRSSWQTGFQIFDRQSGDTVLAFCVDAVTALRIARALNVAEAVDALKDELQ